MSDELSQLVRRCQSGDELAWEALVRRFQGRIYALACHYVGSGEEARDLAQDVFIKIYRSLPAFGQAEAFIPWMLKIARSCAIDHLRRRRVRPPAQDIPVEDMHALADEGAGPEEHLEATADRQLVHQALQSLGEIHREILLMKEIQGIALIDVARILAIPIGTAKSRANRARVELAQAVLQLERARGGASAGGGS
jgi:RNA polymerase sigma-70 factor (ECF subfamily)